MELHQIPPLPTSWFVRVSEWINWVLQEPDIKQLVPFFCRGCLTGCPVPGCVLGVSGLGKEEKRSVCDNRLLWVSVWGRKWLCSTEASSEGNCTSPVGSGQTSALDFKRTPHTNEGFFPLSTPAARTLEDTLGERGHNLSLQDFLWGLQFVWFPLFS